MKTNFLYILIIALLCSCSGEQKSLTEGVDECPQAQLLSLTRHDGYTLAEVQDPWNDGKLLDRYVLVPADADTYGMNLPDGTLLRVPLTSAAVYSSVHGRGFDEVGARSVITGVCDADYFPASLLDSAVVDLGPSLSPSVERMRALAPQAIVLSPYQNSGFGEVALTGIPIVQMADYMETTPLGRAEWIKFIGELTGRRHQADSIYSAVSEEFNRLRDMAAAAASPRPKVLTEQLTSGVWYVPGGASYMAHLIADAGGDYPWASDTHTGSLQLDVERVMAQASDADVWLIRTYGYMESRPNMLQASGLYRHFKAFDSGLYGCDSKVSPIYDVMAFHPEVVLADFIAIFHPDAGLPQPVFYKKID